MICKRLDSPKYAIEHKIKKEAIAEAKHNDDGFYIQKIGDEKHGKLRTMKQKEAVQMVKRLSFDNVILHWRFATHGVKTIANVQGWNIGEWSFAHNGAISDYSETKDQNWSDSWYLFNVLQSRIEKAKAITDIDIANVINEVMQTISFWGRYVLYNNKTDKLYLVGDWKVYKLNNSNLVISSSALRFQGNKEIDIKGFVFNVENDFVIMEKEIDGIGVITNFSKPKFQYQYLNSLKQSYNWSYHQVGYDDPEMDDRAYQDMVDYYDSQHKKPVNELKDFEDWRECCDLELCSRSEYA